jgi:L-aminopeptidase/D-esterase-like protein
MLSSFKIGHYTDRENGTGCTVIVPPKENICSAYAFGASPGTREYALLQPDKKLQSVNALVLTGGSAFGLNAASGVVEELESKGIGYQTPWALVPIVPAAVIYDLNIGSSSTRPGVLQGKAAYKDAVTHNHSSGNVGAGTGATIGKWSGLENAMKGGLGIYQEEHNGLKVCALVVLNSVGDITNKQNKIVAGARFKNGFLAEKRPFSPLSELKAGENENTVLCAILSNAIITKQQANYIAKRAHLGLARRITPSHTSFDGDVSFVLAHGQVAADIDRLAFLTIEAIEGAILNAVNSAETLFGIPSVHDLP